MSGWWNTVGSLDVVSPKRFFTGPKSLAHAAKEGTVLLTLRFPTELFREYSANLSLEVVLVVASPLRRAFQIRRIAASTVAEASAANKM